MSLLMENREREGGRAKIRSSSIEHNCKALLSGRRIIFKSTYLRFYLRELYSFFPPRLVVWRQDQARQRASVHINKIQEQDELRSSPIAPRYIRRHKTSQLCLPRWMARSPCLCVHNHNNNQPSRTRGGSAVSPAHLVLQKSETIGANIEGGRTPVPTPVVTITQRPWRCRSETFLAAQRPPVLDQNPRQQREPAKPGARYRT